VAQAGTRALGDVEDRDRPGREQRPDDIGRLPAIEVRGEPVVDRHHALVGDDVPGHAAADGHGVQALVVAQPVDLRFPGHVAAQHGEDVARLVDGVAAHPGARGMRPLPGGGHLGPERALAAAFDLARTRLHQHRDVAGEQLGGGAAQPQQPVSVGRDLFAVVEDVGHVPAGRGQVRGQPELDRHPGLHVRRAAAVQPGSVGAGGQVAGHGNRVDVPGQDDPFGPPELGAGHDRVPVPTDGQVGERPQRALNGVRQRPLLAADRRNVHELRGQRRAVTVKVEIHPASIRTRSHGPAWFAPTRARPATGCLARQRLGRGAQHGLALTVRVTETGAGAQGCHGT
jgi:hypothetical protein